jgi:ribonuclease P protein component
MIAKQHRFHGHNSVNAMYQRGLMVRDVGLGLRLAPRNRPGFRAAVVVSKKVSKLAVVRNQIRRRLYEQLRQQQLEGYDVVVLVFADSLATAPAAEIATMLQHLTHKAQTKLASSPKTSESRAIIKAKGESR